MLTAAGVVPLLVTAYDITGEPRAGFFGGWGGGVAPKDAVCLIWDKTKPFQEFHPNLLKRQEISRTNGEIINCLSVHIIQGYLS